jgi:hypothetical protein
MQVSSFHFHSADYNGFLYRLQSVLFSMIPRASVPSSPSKRGERPHFGSGVCQRVAERPTERVPIGFFLTPTFSLLKRTRLLKQCGSASQGPTAPSTSHTRTPCLRRPRRKHVSGARCQRYRCCRTFPLFRGKAGRRRKVDGCQQSGSQTRSRAFA